MSTVGLILALIFFVVVLVIMWWPLLMGKPSAVGKVTAVNTLNDTITGLKAQQEAILQSVRDLDFDFRTGKLAEPLYQQQREALLQQGAELLREIDEQKSILIDRAVGTLRNI